MRVPLVLLFSILSFVSIITGLVCIPRLETFFTALFSALVFGSISPLIAARRLFFLAVEASHMALLAATLSIAISNIMYLGGEVVWAILLGLFMIYSIGFAIFRGIDPDIATSIATSISVSSSVIAMHIILTRYRVGYSLWSIVLGDPLLVTWRDIYVLIIVAFTVLIISSAIYKVIIYIGVDKDSAMLTYRKIYVYEFLFFTILGLSSIVLLKIVGYVVEHILLLLPALIAMNIVEGGKNIVFISICASIISSIIGFTLSIAINTAPAGIIGVITLILYISSLAINRLRRHG